MTKERALLKRYVKLDTGLRDGKYGGKTEEYLEETRQWWEDVHALLAEPEVEVFNNKAPIPGSHLGDECINNSTPLSSPHSPEVPMQSDEWIEAVRDCIIALSDSLNRTEPLKRSYYVEKVVEKLVAALTQGREG